MLILASNNDKLQVTTSGAGAIDVHASWMDNVSGAVAPGRTNTPTISTAATVTVVASPAVGVVRSIKTLHIFNKGTTSNTITVVHTDGTTAVEIHKAALPPLAGLQYIDEIGFVLNVAGGTAGLSGTTKLIAQRVISTQVDHVDFTSAINEAYNEYELHMIGMRVNNDCYAGLRVSKNNGTTWEASPEMDYGHLFQYWDMNSVDVMIAGWDDHLWLNNGFGPSISDSFATNVIYLKFAFPQKSNVRKQFFAQAVGDASGQVLQTLIVGGEFWDDTNSNPAINAIRIMLMPEGGPAKFIAGTFNFYGTRA